MKTMPENLKEYEIKVGLALNGISLADAARKLGLSLPHVSMVIRGQRESKKTMDAINSLRKNVKIIVEG